MKKTLGMLIAEIRKEKGMTQLELAEKMGVTDKAVSKWERDLSCPDVNSLPALAEILGVSLDEMMHVKSGKTAAEHETGALVNTICKGIALAMGVAVAVLTALDALAPSDAMSLLGIGLACLAVGVMRQQN